MEKELTISVLQDIILELRDNSVVVLKAGSYIPFPNGSETGWIEVSLDKEWTPPSVGTFFLFISYNGNWVYRATTGSGSNLPTSGTLAFYKTNENKIYNITNGSTSSDTLSFPFAKITYENGTTTIDEVFNGFGYIGDVIYSLPEISCEIPYGRDSDGNPIFKTCVTDSFIITQKDGDFPFFIGNGNTFTGVHFANSYDIYNRTSNIYYDDGTVIYGRPFNRDTVIVSPIEQSVISSESKQLNISLPQDINLELNDGTLTLKAGSKVYIPNGPGLFDILTISNDVIFHTGTIGSNNVVMIGCNSSGSFGYRSFVSSCASGTTNPGPGYNVWYDTTKYLVKFSANAD